MEDTFVSCYNLHKKCMRPKTEVPASSCHEWLTTKICVAVRSEQNVGETTTTDISGIQVQPNNSGAEVWA
jgi:hypothetical protein